MTRRLLNSSKIFIVVLRDIVYIERKERFVRLV